MAEPLVVVIPHKLGQAEATRRIKDGIGRARGETQIPPLHGVGAVRRLRAQLPGP